MNSRKKANLIIIFTIAIFAFSSSLVVASLTSDVVDLNIWGLPELNTNQIDNGKLNTVDGDFSPATVNKIVAHKSNNNSNNNNSNNSNKTKPNDTLTNSSR